MTTLSSPLTLPCGLVLPNRLAKAAMTEQLAVDGEPTERLERLYARFREGGAGLVLTGNAMVDRDHREHPRNVVIDAHTKGLERLARAAGPGGMAQLSHPGRQALWTRGQPVAPSAVKLRGMGAVFEEPRALGADEIVALVERFAEAAHLCDLAGFAGVEVHGAHGYLPSQFLSPRTNHRTDEWGGSLENRARFLLSIVERVRARVRPGFALLVKLNSADFQRGGFEDADALAVARMLEGKIDLLEISGGSYEAPAMVGLRASTRAREAYFLEFAQRLRQHTKTPLMVTGGFRTVDAMQSAVSSGAIDVVGLARPLAMEPDLPRRVLAGDRAPARTGRDRLGVRGIDDVLAAQFYVEQLHRLADGKAPNPKLSRLWTLAHAMWMSRG